MAGIGFELRKLFHEQGLLSSIRAYGYSSLTTAGPTVLCISMIIAMQQMMTFSGAPFLERELLLATVVYCFIFSILITGGISMLLTRFISDAMFNKQYDHLLSSLYGAIAVCLPVGAISAWLFLRGISASFGYKAAAFLFFTELIVVWLQAVHLSALKDYKRIVRNFLYGIAIAVLGSWIVLTFTAFKSATAVLVMIDIGFLVIALLSARHFEHVFPPRSSKLYFQFLSYIRKYPALFFIGTFFYAGVYIHSLVYWLGPFHATVADSFVISPLYDLPVFYAYLTIIPTLVTFVVSLETNFYEKYRDYYTKILNGGNYAEVTRAKRDMQRTLMQEISFIMEVQLLFTVISIALGIKLLPAIGFTMEQLETFNLLVLAYYLFITAFIVMLLMLYFDDRKGALVTSSLFVVLNAGLTFWTMQAENHGLGMFLASFLTLAVALARLVSYVRNVDYHTFCTAPTLAKGKNSQRRPGAPLWKKPSITTTTSAFMLIAATVLLAGCTSNADGTEVEKNPNYGLAEPVVKPFASLDGFHDDKRIYERDVDTDVIPLYVTILPDSSKEDGVDWYSLNRIRSRMEEGKLDVIVQEGAADGSGPVEGSFGYGATEPNAKIGIRGNSARYAAQRSYKIKLNSEAGLWHDQRIVNLNKHYYDPSRLRQKLSYDFFEEMKDISSLRTQYVHLFVKDLSPTSDDGDEFVDYGLFTHVENPNKMYLKNHWLDPNGQFYKANMFEFFRYPDVLKSQSDPTYDREAFEQVLQIEGREDHDKLLKMLDDVNNDAIPINEVIEKHFDLDNYLTWLASNLLMDNMDTNTQNYLLYSPLNSDKWYFVPWDYDGGFELQRSHNGSSDFESGLSNYWNVVLHNRFFRSQENVNLLKAKMDELYQLINNDSVAKRIELYRPIVEFFTSRSPDKNFWTIKNFALDEELRRIIETPARSMKRFEDDLQRPKPVFLGDLSKNADGSYTFFWDQSFDLQGDDLFYDWSLAKDPAFTQIVEEQKDLTVTEMKVKSLAPGTYYWKVIIRDKEGHKQVAFDQYEDDEDNKFFGIRQIKVE
ncbi:exopolysaccharide Pel transporter PelG [Paenibacillus sp. GCM10027626]|uniref:exopolysaccharide Pel transporter PelG n=1 Tax=Paenibacillus sp. GCM10027626 TaxID=3273411 RepID=UPI00363A0D07